MKKNLALLLCLALCLSSLIGLTAYAEETETTLPAAPEIALVNVSIRSNVAMLFAVPVGDFTVNNDGTVDGLNLLVWKGESETGRYGRGSADATLKAQGKLVHGGETYVVFVYTGLTAKEMTDTVYARTVVSDGKGNIAYGEAIDYSITEWAKNYETTSEKNKALAENLLAYGSAMQVYRDDYKPNGYYAEQAKDLVTVTVNSKVAGETVQSQVTQLAVAGETITLAAPIVDGYSVSEWSVSDADAETEGVQIVVDADTVIDATFSPASLAYESMWGAAFEKATATVDSVTSGKGMGIPMLSGLDDMSGNVRFNTGAVAYASDNNAYVSYAPKADGNNKYLCLTSTAGGAIYAANESGANSLKPSDYDIAANGGYLTVTFSLMRNEAGRIIDSLGLRIRANGTGVNENMRVFSTSADGTVSISVFKNGNLNEPVKTKVGEVAESGWSHFAFVIDLENLLIHGYMKDESGNWQLKATSAVFIPSNYDSIYDWLGNVGRFEWEVSHAEVEQKVWESVVSAEDRDYVENGTDLTERSDRLAKIAEKYFSMNIDNYEIFSGDAIN